MAEIEGAFYDRASLWYCPSARYAFSAGDPVTALSFFGPRTDADRGQPFKPSIGGMQDGNAAAEHAVWYIRFLAEGDAPFEQTINLPFVQGPSRRELSVEAKAKASSSSSAGHSLLP